MDESATASRLQEMRRLKQLQGPQPSYWAQRITAQLLYGFELAAALRCSETETVVHDGAALLHRLHQRDGAITDQAAKEVERSLQELSARAKQFSMVLVSHAHIDMNWMWGYHETTAITLETFRTMLDLMQEYPRFTFSQSQASVYRIVERHAPAMLEEIRQRVQEGRWEVTASTWVETDKNMPCGESLARHLLYSKRYLKRLFGLEFDDLQLDYEPDTFGHSRNVPQILTKGGVQYYYHCRGYDGHAIYRWQAPAGSEILVYREPTWYNADIPWDVALHVPAFCREHGLDSMLKVYGVGDHGGGPTRRDIERIIDMDDWPVYPRMEFGSYHGYFRQLEKGRDSFPVVDNELNFVFTGCYTSQSRIKQANAVGERTLYDAEVLSCMAAALVPSVPAGLNSGILAEGWEHVLFNQFHDILPGSGTAETREHAMGLFQETMAIANTQRTAAMRSISQHIDGAAWFCGDDVRESRAEGAGVGFGVPAFVPSQTSRGAGSPRVFQVFNSTAAARREPVEFVVWDWEYDADSMEFRDYRNEPVQHQFADQGRNHYWGHDYTRVLVDVDVPPMGYASYVLQRVEPEHVKQYPQDPRVERPASLVLENQYLRAEFDPKTAWLVSLVDKEKDAELVERQQGGGRFRLITEDESQGMTAWHIGRYMDIQDLAGDVRLQDVDTDGELRKSFGWRQSFGASTLEVTVSLDRNGRSLRYDLTCGWYEKGAKGRGVPQLNFALPLHYNVGRYRYDVPFAAVERSPMDMDVPANSWAAAWPHEESGPVAALCSRDKYGFRGWNHSLCLSLIHSSIDPDPAPEFGTHRTSFSVGVLPGQPSNRTLAHWAERQVQPLSVYAGRPGKGSLPAADGLLQQVEGPVMVSALKQAEDGEADAFILRLYETEGRSGRAAVGFTRALSRAELTDIHERVASEQDAVRIAENGKQLEVPVQAHEVVTIRLQFSKHP